MSYLTIAEYISRFGERETILLTNTTAPAPGVTPTYDSAKVDAAIGDAQEVVEGYVGKRYTVPIASPPRIVKGWVAALAREALHVNTGKTNDAVEGAANRARAQLKEVSVGLLSLPVDEGQPAPSAQSQGYARSSNDRPAPTFAGNGILDELTAPFTGGTSSACWRGGR